MIVTTPPPQARSSPPFSQKSPLTVNAKGYSGTLATAPDLMVSVPLWS